jgi:hypothetical protein
MIEHEEADEIPGEHQSEEHVQFQCAAASGIATRQPPRESRRAEERQHIGQRGEEVGNGNEDELGRRAGEEQVKTEPRARDRNPPEQRRARQGEHGEGGCGEQGFGRRRGHARPAIPRSSSPAACWRRCPIR